MRKIKFIFQKEYESFFDAARWSKILEEAKLLGFTHFFLRLLDDVNNAKLKEFLNLLANNDFIVEMEDKGAWDEERKDLFVSSRINLFCLTFLSLHDDETNLAKLDFLRDRGLSIGLRFVLTKDNLDEFLGLPKFLQSLKCLPQDIVIEEISPLEGRFFKEDSIVTAEQLKTYLPYLKGHVSGALDHQNPCVKFYSNYQNNEHYPFVSGEEMVVEPNGDVRPFPLFGTEKIGNVFTDSFSVISEKLIEELNRLTLEKAEKGLFLNWSSIAFHHLKPAAINFQDINRVIMPQNPSILMNKTCNFRCDFCEFGCGPDDKETIDISDFEKVLREGKRLGFNSVFFDGGEPLLHPKIKEAFALVGELGYRAYVQTNGWHFQEFVDDFRKNGVSNFTFGLFGASAQTHDAICGKEGAFDRCVAAIKLSKKLGYATGLHGVIHPLSFHELDKFLDLAEQWGVTYIMISSIIPLGRAKDNRNLILSEEKKAEIPKIYQRHQDFLSKIIFQGYRPQAGRYLPCRYLKRSEQVSVHWDGSVGLCSMTPELKLPFPKLKDRSLIDCLIYLNKINELFQAERNREFPRWRPEVKEVHGCPYCHKKLSADTARYFDKKDEDFLN